MPSVKIKKQDLLEALRKNREEHRTVFEEALEGYRKRVIEVLGERLRAARKGEKIDMTFRLAEPMDQTKDYDRVIRMMEMSTEEIIELGEHEFQQYVMDEWTWAKGFSVNNSSYVSSDIANDYMRKISKEF